MANWKKLIASGSDAHLNSITASSNISASGHLFASLSLSPSTAQFVTVDTSSGQLYFSNTASSTSDFTEFNSTLTVDSENIPFDYDLNFFLNNINVQHDDGETWFEGSEFIVGSTISSFDFDASTSAQFKLREASNVTYPKREAFNIVFDFGTPVIVSEFRTTFQAFYSEPKEVFIYGSNTDFDGGATEGTLLAEGAKTPTGQMGNPVVVLTSEEGVKRTSSIAETSLTSSFQYYRLRFSGSLNPGFTHSIYDINQITPVTRSFQTQGSGLNINNGVLNVTQIITNILQGDVIGNVEGNLEGTASFSTTASYATTASFVVTSSYLDEFSVFNGNRPITNFKFDPTVYGETVGTTGSLTEFIEQLYFPNVPPTITNTTANLSFTIEEFDTHLTFGGHLVLGTDSDAHQTLNWGLNDEFFEINSNTGKITLKETLPSPFTSVGASTDWNVTENPYFSGNAHEMLVTLSDNAGGFTSALVYVEVSPNSPPIFRSFTTELPKNNDGHYVFTASVFTPGALTPGLKEGNPEGKLFSNSGQTSTQFTSPRFADLDGDTMTVNVPPPEDIGLSHNGDPIFSCSVNYSANSLSTFNRIDIFQVTSSLDFDHQSQFDFMITAEDEHGAASALEVHIEIKDNVAPSVTPKTITINENRCTSSLDESIGFLEYTDPEGNDPIYLTTNFQLLNVYSSSENFTVFEDDIKDTLSTTDAGGPSDGLEGLPNKDPFIINANGQVFIKAAAQLNSDIANKYIYQVTVTDTFNLNPNSDTPFDSNTGQLTINIEDDPIPVLNFNTGDGNGFIIESALSGDTTRTTSDFTNTEEYTITSATGESVILNIATTPSNFSVFGLDGGSTVGTSFVPTFITNISGSNVNALSNPITLHITASKNNFQTSKKQIAKQIIVYANTPPTLTLDPTSSQQHNNSIIYNAAEGVNLRTVSVAVDSVEGDAIDWSSVEFTNPTNKLAYAVDQANSNININIATGYGPYQGISENEELNFTLTIKDVQGFHFSNLIDHTITILPKATPTVPNVTGHIIESSDTIDDNVVTTEGGTSGVVITDNFADPGVFPDGNLHITKFDITNTDGLEDIFEIFPLSDFGSTNHDFVVRTKSILSGSQFKFDGSSKTITTSFTDNFDQVYTGPNVTLTINRNNAPVLTDSGLNFISTNYSGHFNTNKFREGNGRTALYYINVNDPENDTILDSGVALNGNNNFEIIRDTTNGTGFLLIRTIANPGKINAGTYNFTASINDIHNFRTSSFARSITLQDPPIPTVTTNGSSDFSFHISENTSSGAPIKTSYISNFFTEVGGADATVTIAWPAGYENFQNASCISDNTNIQPTLISGNGRHDNPATFKLNYIGSPKDNRSEALTANLTFSDTKPITPNTFLKPITVSIQQAPAALLASNNSDASDFGFHIIETTGSNAPVMTSENYTNGKNNGIEGAFGVTFPGGHGNITLNSTTPFSSSNHTKIIAVQKTSNSAKIEYVGDPSSDTSPQTATITVRDNFDNTSSIDVSVEIFENEKPEITFSSQGVTAFNNNGAIPDNSTIFTGTITDKEHDFNCTVSISGTNSGDYRTVLGGTNNKDLTILTNKDIIDTSNGSGINHSITVRVTDSEGKFREYTKNPSYTSVTPRLYAYKFNDDLNSSYKGTIQRLGLIGEEIDGFTNFDTHSQYQTAPFDMTQSIANNSILDELVVHGKIGTGSISTITFANKVGSVTTNGDAIKLKLLKSDTIITDLLDNYGDGTTDQGFGDLGPIHLDASGGGDTDEGKFLFFFPSSSILANKPHGMSVEPYSGDIPDPNLSNIYKIAASIANFDSIINTRVAYFTTSTYIYGYNRWGMIFTKNYSGAKTTYYLITDETEL